MASTGDERAQAREAAHRVESSPMPRLIRIKVLVSGPRPLIPGVSPDYFVPEWSLSSGISAQTDNYVSSASECS